eukprot:scaffold73380_cov60-Phaeocystis_antarctica.AAC.1
MGAVWAGILLLERARLSRPPPLGDACGCEARLVASAAARRDARSSPPAAALPPASSRST